MPYTVAKQWYESKTVWLNVVTFAVALLAILSADEMFAPYAKYLVLGQSVLNLILRLLTGQPITSGPGGPTKWLLILPGLLVSSLLAGPAAAADSVILVKNVTPGQHVLVLDVGQDGSIEVRRAVIAGIIGGDGPIDPINPPPPAAGLEAAARKALAAVPAHEKKELTAQALAGIFLEVGKQHAAGKLSTEDLFPTLETAMDTVLNALGVTPHWTGFRKSIKDAINAEQLTPAQIQPAFEDLASGLTSDNQALLDIAPHVMALIQAIIAKDQAAVIQAVIQIVIALIGT